LSIAPLFMFKLCHQCLHLKSCYEVTKGNDVDGCMMSQRLPSFYVYVITSVSSFKGV